MSRRLQVVFVALVCIYSQAGAVQILSCKKPISYVEKLDEFRLLCHGSGDRASVFQWTLTDDKGTSVHLGTCPTPYDCTTLSNSSSFALSRDQFSLSSVFFRDTGLSGNVVCTERFVNGSEESSGCRIKAMKIKMDRKQPTFSNSNDGSRVHFKCSNTPQPQSTVAWSLTTISGQTLDLGNCTDVDVCRSPFSPNVTVRRTSDTESRVDFVFFQREEFAQLRCLFTSDGVTAYDGFTVYTEGAANTTGNINWPLVGVVVALAVVVVVLLIVMILLYRRGTFNDCPCRESTRYDIPQPQSKGRYAYDTRTSQVSEVYRT